MVVVGIDPPSAYYQKDGLISVSMPGSIPGLAPLKLWENYTHYVEQLKGSLGNGKEKEVLVLGTESGSPKIGGKVHHIHIMILSVVF